MTTLTDNDHVKHFSVDDPHLHALLDGKINKMVKYAIANEVLREVVLARDAEEAKEAIESNKVAMSHRKAGTTWTDGDESKLEGLLDFWVGSISKVLERSEWAVLCKIEKIVKSRRQW